MPARRGLNATTLMLALALAGHGAAAVSPAEWAAAGSQSDQRPLSEALKRLQALGLNLVFSSTLVKPRHRATFDIDRDASLTDQARALLEPLGLGLERSGADVWYVVRVAPETDAAAERQPGGAAQPPIVEEVLVSSSRYRLVRDSHERQQLDARRLESVPSIGRDLLRAVNQLPGQASVGVSARSHMRGGNTNEVLYLVDGVQVIEPFHMGDFHALFSTINPALVDSIDVYHAGFPAAFGTRLSGVVDMELAEAEQPLQGRVNVDFLNAYTQAQGQSGRTEWLVSARRSTVDYLLDYVDQDYGRPQFHDELMRLSWQGEESDVTAGVLYSVDELRLEDGSAGETARADYHNLVSWLKASHDLGEHAQLELSGSFTDIDNRRRGYMNDPVDAVGRLEETRDFTVALLQSAMRWRAADHWLIHAGVEAQHQSARFDVDIASRYGLLGAPLQPDDTLQRTVSTERDGSLLTAFVSARREISESLTVEYGLRYDAQNVDPVHDNQLSPRVQVSFERDRWHAFLNVGRYAQHQNLYELQLDDGLLELNDPQLADQISAGAGWNPGGRWNLRIEAYWREIDDPWSRFENLYNRWVLLPELHADRVSLMPVSARTFGGEVVAGYRPRDNLRWTVSMGVARAEEHLDGQWRPRPWEQRRTLRSSLDWRRGDWRIGLAAAYHSGWPTTSLITQPLTGPARLYDQHLPGYFSLDVHVARRIALPNSELEVYFDLSNATFAGNVGGYRYELDDGALARDERLLLPPVPVFGVSWYW